MNIYSKNSNIDIRHFRAALIVADTRSFARAAERLHVVPSALTETIRQLEAAIGVQMFDRKTRPVTLTSAGEDFIVVARRVVADFAATISDMRRLGGLERGLVRVGAAPSMVHFPLSAAIADLRGRHRNIDVTIFDDIAGKLGSMVLDRIVDFALAEPWHDTDQLLYEPLLEDRFVLVCHREHELAGRGSVSLAEIAAQETITLDDSTGIGKLLAQQQALPAPLRVSRLRAQGTIALLIMIANGMGVSLLPQLAASVLQSANIVQVPVSDLALQRRLCLVTRRGASLSPAASALIGLIRARLADYRPS